MNAVSPLASKWRAGLMSAGQALLMSGYAGKYKDLDAAWGEFAQGVPWSSSPDVGPVLNTALAQFSTAGGARMQLPVGNGNQATSLACPNWRGISLIGRRFGDFGFDPTMLTWIGAAGGTQIDWRSPNGGSAIPTIASELSGFLLEGNGLAGIGVMARSLQDSRFDLKIHNPTSRAFDLDVIAGTQYFDVANNDISLYFLADSAAAANASGLVIGPGSSILDTHSNRFHVLRAQFQNGIAFDIGNTDSNHFFRVYASRILGGTGVGMKLRAGPAVLMRCRSNVFFLVDMPSTPLVVEGTDVATVASQNNRILYYNYESGMPAPTIGPGATLGGTDNTGQPIGNLGLAGPRTTTNPALGATGSPGPGGTVTVTYRKVGREVDATVVINVTTAQGSGLINVTLPFVAATKANFSGRSEITGKQLQGVIQPGSALLQIIDCDNNYPASGTGILTVSGRYEANS